MISGGGGGGALPSFGPGIKLLPMRLYHFKIKHFIKLYRSVEKTATNGDDFVVS